MVEKSRMAKKILRSVAEDVVHAKDNVVAAKQMQVLSENRMAAAAADAYGENLLSIHEISRALDMSFKGAQSLIRRAQSWS